MKRFILVVSVLLFCAFPCVTVTAQEKLSCEELTEIANDLDEIAVAFEDAGDIEEGDAVDEALGELVDALIALSDIENDSAMNRAVDNLIEAYNNFDGDGFADSLDNVILNLDRLNRRDCRDSTHGIGINDKVKVSWKGEWYDAVVIEQRDANFKIHYVGYDNSWDEWVTLDRIRVY